MSSAARVLLIEDDYGIRQFLRAAMEPGQYQLLEAVDGLSGIRRCSETRPDLVLLDLGLPDIDGVEVTRRLREWCDTPIVVLSARGQERDKIVALDAGADDYLTKPFSVGELFARMRVALRHRRRDPVVVVTTPDFTVDLDARTVSRRGEPVHLTPNEYKLLAALARDAGRVVTQRQLLAEVWGEAYAQETHYLRIYMGQLRHKLEDDPAQPRTLITEPGVGYRLLVDN